MKTKRTTLVLMTAITMLAVMFQACKKDDDGPKDLNIVSLTVGDSDLNSATSPADVATDASLTITFNTDIKAETANESTITLVQDYDGVNIPLNISVSGATLTIKPKADLGQGMLYQFNLTSGLLNKDDQPLAQTSRTFNTAGTFAPSGAIAYYNFDGTAEDAMGSYNPSASGVIDISYTDSRNSAAGKAAQFNGSTSIIEVPGGSDIISTSAFTLSMWLKPDTLAHGGGNFVISAGGFNGFEVELNRNDAKMAAQYVLQDGSSSASEDLWVDGTGNTDFQGWTFSKDYTAQGGFVAVVQAKWTHFVFQYDSESKVGRAYINGKLAKTQDFTAYPEDNPKYMAGDLTFNSQDGLGENLAIGYYSDRATTIYGWVDYSDPNTNHYSGLMDDIRIYHKVLTETEIRMMYDSEK